MAAKSLFEDVQENACLFYLSDVRNRSNDSAVYPVVSAMNASDYELDEWKRLLFYITAENPCVQNAEEAQAYLLDYLKPTRKHDQRR